jgi:hypothetical protein
LAKTLNKNGVTWTSSTPIMNKLASSDVYQNVTRAHAHQHVDCVNECEAAASDSEQELDELDASSGHCQFTSSLVEDGFIRMSSPVESLGDLIDLRGEASARQCATDAVRNSGERNFPNVGSSPVDFDESSSEDERDNLQVLEDQLHLDRDR